MSRAIDAVVYAQVKRQNGQLLISGVAVERPQNNEATAKPSKHGTPEDASRTDWLYRRFTRPSR